MKLPSATPVPSLPASPALLTARPWRSRAAAIVSVVLASWLLAGCDRSPPEPARQAAFLLDSLPSPAGPGSAEPFLATAKDGRVYMTWFEADSAGGAQSLRFASLDGKSWSPARTIVSGKNFFVNWADFPSLLPLDNGDLAAHWLERTGSGTYAYGVQVARSTDGGITWSTPITLHRDSSETEHGFVTMWNEPETPATLGAAWLDGRKFKAQGHDAANEMMLVSTTVDQSGILGAETPLDGRTCDCCQNASAVTSDGPIVAYRNRTADEIRDIYITRRVLSRSAGNDSAASWTQGASVHDDNWKIAACPVNGPALDAQQKRVAIAWFTAANDSAQVKVAFSSDAGETFSSPTRVDGGNPTGRTDVALLNDGGALVTWIERTGGDTAAVMVRRVAADGTVGASHTVATSFAARASGFPKATIDGTRVIFAWTVPGKPSSIRVASTSLSALP